jgi:antitoxin (DNA-binding transcriptional repressor) of toxin-antitoxin stability system
VHDKNMDVAVTDLRAHLSEWLERARGGDEIVITDRSAPGHPGAPARAPGGRWPTSSANSGAKR